MHCKPIAYMLSRRGASASQLILSAWLGPVPSVDTLDESASQCMHWEVLSVARRKTCDYNFYYFLVRLSQNSRFSLFNGAKRLRCFQGYRRARSWRCKRLVCSCSIRDVVPHGYTLYKITAMPVCICGTVIAGVHFFPPKGFRPQKPCGE